MTYLSSVIVEVCFNPRTYIRYDTVATAAHLAQHGFNPRTYIRYDDSNWGVRYNAAGFQSTYLYKVRRRYTGCDTKTIVSFNPRTYIRYDQIILLTPNKMSVSIHVPI